MTKSDPTLEQSDLFASELPSEIDLVRQAVIRTKTRINLLLWDLLNVARSHGKCLAVRFDSSTTSSCTLNLISVFLDPGELPPLGFAWTLYSSEGPANVQA